MPVLALHDLLADRGQLRPLAEPPHDARFRLTLPDARGHGASPMLSGRAYPPSELAADALAVLDAEGLPSAHLVAIGWAAATALALAATAPQRVASLVLAAPYLPALRRGKSRCGGSPDRVGPPGDDARGRGPGRKGADGPRPRPVPGRADWRGLARPLLETAPRRHPPLGREPGAAAGGHGWRPIDPDALTSLDMPVVLLVKDDAEVLERVTVETLALAHASRADRQRCREIPTSRWLAARSGQRRSWRRW